MRHVALDTNQAVARAIAILKLLKSEVTPYRQISELAHELRESNAGQMPEIMEIIERAKPAHKKLFKRLLDINDNPHGIATAQAV